MLVRLPNIRRDRIPYPAAFLRRFIDPVSSKGEPHSAFPLSFPMCALPVPADENPPGSRHPTPPAAEFPCSDLPKKLNPSMKSAGQLVTASHQALAFRDFHLHLECPQ